MKRHLTTLLLCLAVTGLGAQNHAHDPKIPLDYAGHSHEMYSTAAMKYSFDRYDASEWQTWQKELRAELKKLLGITVIEEKIGRFVPEARFISTEDAGFAMRERWEIWTEPDVVIPIVVLRPKGLEGKVPLMITPHGHGKNTESYAGVYHNEKERESGEVGERNVAVQAAQHGFIAIAPTARGFGKTRSPKDIEEDNTSSCRELMLRDALVGRTPVGDRVWDIMKIIDWALANLPVDEGNIIVSGNSGGGTATAYAGAIDTRIAMSLPASAFCDYEPSIGLRRHCECNYIPHIMEYCDMGEIGGLTAPRGFCVIHGVQDPIFPIAGTRHAFSVTKKVYEAAGVPENCELYEGPEGHRYYKAGAWDFIERHLGRIPVVKDTLPAWKPGELDIHFISTGGGNSSLMVLPDGTTVLVDAGDMGRSGNPVNLTPVTPDASRTPGEWIADYIRHFAPEGEAAKLDFALITHFHDDHMGAGWSALRNAEGGYPLSGITEVGTLIPIGTIIDRGFTFPVDIDTDTARYATDLRKMLQGYRDFIGYQGRNNGMKHESVDVGSSKQIRMVHDPKQYRDFSIRMLFANGQVADPKKHRIASSKFEKGQYPDENNLSAGFRLDYGKFTFYSGGDIPGIGHTGAMDAESMECRVADVIGPVDVAVLNHHGNRDTQNEKFVSTLAPRVWIGATWGVRHPGEEVIRRITSRYLYEGDRDIYATHLAPAARDFLGRYLKDYKSFSGHIVIRVAPGGESYEVYVLDESDRSVVSRNEYHSR